MKKLLALILALCCALPLLACGGGTGTGPNTEGKYNVKDASKTQINFTVYGGGLDGEWADIITEEFAKLHAGTVFEEGKKGVWINMNRTFNVQYTGLSNSAQHIITATSNSWPSRLANSGDYYSLTDIVTDDKREGGKIEDALFDNVKAQLKANDGNYYALPYFEYYNGLQYNRGIFSEKNALFADASDTTAKAFDSKFSDTNFKLTNDNGILSKGPDGVSGTEDDGLPASLEELLVLMDYFKRKTDYYPIVVSGACVNYTNGTIAGLWSSLAGQTQMQNYYNCSGEIEIVKRDGAGNIEFYDEDIFPGVNYIKKPKTEKVVLNDTNGYLGSDMVSRFYAMAFMEIAQKENWFSPNSQQDSISHYDAQLALMTGKRLPKYYNAAMLVEYSYWYNETKNSGNFNQLKAIGKTESDYDVRYMSGPTSLYYSSEQSTHPSALEIASQYYMFVNKNITKDAGVEKAVVEFVKYFYSEATLKKITSVSGFPLSLEYELTDDELSGMSTYFQHVWKSRKTDGSNVIFNAGSSVGAQLNGSRLESDKLMVSRDLDYAHVYAGIKALGTEKFFNDSGLVASEWSLAQ